MKKMLIAAALAALALPAAAAESAAPAGSVPQVAKVNANPKADAAKKEGAHLTKARHKQGKKKHPPKHEAQVAPKG